jgi:sugar lactone lactonase YvrE
MVASGLVALSGCGGGGGGSSGGGSSSTSSSGSTSSTSSSGTSSSGSTSSSGTASTPQISLLAGTSGDFGSADGIGAAARFYNPTGVATDNAGNVYVLDDGNRTIRKITPAGVVTTLAGGAGVVGEAIRMGYSIDSSYPAGVTTDSAGNVYAFDRENFGILKIAPNGVVTTLAGGAGVSGGADGTGAAASFSRPAGLATDSAGNVYVADTFNNSIRKITSGGVVSIYASKSFILGAVGSYVAQYDYCYPTGVALDSSGNVYASETWYNAIIKITTTGISHASVVAGASETFGSTDGTGRAARFNHPSSIATNSDGEIYVTDTNNSTIRKITPSGVVSTLAGTAGIFGSADGAGAAASFRGPGGVATDSVGNVYVADMGNNTVRKLTPDGVVTTLAGEASVSGSADGAGSAARFDMPFGLAADSAGNVYVADAYNDVIRKITPAGVVSTFAGTADSAGNTNGTGAAARFKYPVGVATGGNGNVYVADADNHAIRKITSAGVVSTLASVDDPIAVAVDSADNVYVADTKNNAIRKVTPAGVVTTLPGTFDGPLGVATDGAGNVYVADTGNTLLKKITPAGSVTTLATTGGAAWSKYDPPLSYIVILEPPHKELKYPIGIAVDGAGNVYVADTGHSAILKVTAAGVVTTLAGVSGEAGFQTGDLPGFVTRPSGLAISGRTLYFSLPNGVGQISNLP